MIFIVLRGKHLFLEPYLSIILIPEFPLTVNSLQSPYPLSADHDALRGKNLSQSPLKHLANRDNIQDSDGIQPTSAGSANWYSQKQASNKKKYEKERDVEGEAPDHHLVGNRTLGGRVEGIWNLPHPVDVLLVYFNLGQTVDGFCEEVDHLISALKE